MLDIFRCVPGSPDHSISTGKQQPCPSDGTATGFHRRNRTRASTIAHASLLLTAGSKRADEGQ